MPASDSKSSSTLGYLTYVRIPSHGIVGGLLLVNDRARPIEFHCTAPVQLTRAQRILYGSSVRSALLCDRIGKALLAQATKKVDLLLTDIPDAFGLREPSKIPVALFASDEDTPAVTLRLFDEQAEEGQAEDESAAKKAMSADGSLSREWSFEFAGYSFTSTPDYPEDQDLVRSTLLQLARDWDLAEPLERIRAAIQEAQRAAA